MTGLPGFLAAVGLGALHSLEPGHGKGIMGSYLAVSRGSLKDILALGVTSALTHTAVVLALALALHSAAGAVSTGSGLPAARFEGYLRLASGLLIMAIGVVMFRRAVSAKKRPGCGCPGHGSFGRGSSHPAAGAFLVGLGNGLMPCPGSLAVILMSLNTGNLWSGLWVVLGFGIGGAISLVAVGLLFSRLASLAGFSSGGGPGRLVTLASSGLITAIGFFTLTGSLFN
ncbi:MAG: sulfite exporter TauE/SafE family protein [Bacillota bacterium]